jgi:BlaI family penicillinase repressor
METAMRPQTPGLTDHELKIMRILWKEPELTIAEIRARFPQKPQPAYTSLLTAVRGLERKKFVAHRQDGKAYRYLAKVSRSQYSTQSVRRLVQNLFDGRPAALAIALVETEALDQDEIERLKRALEAIE